MQHLISALDRIKLIPGARVDRCFLQGREVMLEQLTLRFSDDHGVLMFDPIPKLDDMIESAHEAFEDVQEWVKPYQFPESYSFFLAYCGGFSIFTDSYNLSADGIGLMTDEWYEFLIGDEESINPEDKGFVTIARLISEIPINGRYPEVCCCLDLAGVIQEDAVIGIAPSQGRITPIIEDFDAYPDHWNVLAPSFAEWLELVADTDGLLGYEF